MKKIILTSLLLISLSIVYSNQQKSFAAAPTCSSLHGGYCQFIGKISQVYINSGNTILVYFDAPMAEGEAQIAGFSATQRYAAAIQINQDNEVFAKSFYATALTAVASDKTVVIQMRGNVSSYLKMDRIWIRQ